MVLRLERALGSPVLLNPRLSDPHPRVSDSAGLGWASRSAVCAGFQEILPLVRGLHFENHWIRLSLLKLYNLGSVSFLFKGQTPVL